MFPHWDKQVILLRGDNVEDWEKTMNFSCFIFNLLSLLLPSVEIIESGSCFYLEVRWSLISQGGRMHASPMNVTLDVFLWRKQWLDVACPDHQSHHVKFGVPFVTLAALLSQSVSGYEPFWATEMWNDWNTWPTYCEYNGAGSYYLREINMIKWMNELNKNGNSDWGYSWITAYSLHAYLKFQKFKSYIQTLSGLQ